RTTRTLACAVTHMAPGTPAIPGPDDAGVRLVLDGEALYTGPSGGPNLTLARHDLVRTRDVRYGEWRAGERVAVWLDVLDRALGGDAPAAPGGRCPFPRVHRWEKTDEVLAEGGLARFGSPATGGDLTRTLRVEVHRLEAAVRSPSVRAGHSTVVAALTGSGTS